MSAYITCPGCGSRILATDPQCLNCGAALDEGRLAAAPGTKPPATPPEVDVPGLPYRTTPGARAWDPRSVGVGGGFLERLSRGWSFLGQAWGLLGQDGRLLIPSTLAMLSTFVVLGITVLILRQTGAWQGLMDKPKSPESETLFWAIGIPLSLLIYVITYFFQGMTVNLVADLLRGQRRPMSFGLRDSLKNFPALALLALASVVVGLLVGIIRGNRRNWLTAKAANAVQSAWYAVVLLTLPVIILEDKGVVAAFARAGQLHGRHLGDLLVAWFGVGLVNRVLAAVAMVVAVGVAFLLYGAMGAAALPLIIVILAMTMLLVSVLATYLSTAYYTCLYLWAEAAEEVQSSVPAPAPLAAVGW